MRQGCLIFLKFLESKKSDQIFLDPHCYSDVWVTTYLSPYTIYSLEIGELYRTNSRWGLRINLNGLLYCQGLCEIHIVQTEISRRFFRTSYTLTVVVIALLRPTSGDRRQFSIDLYWKGVSSYTYFQKQTSRAGSNV